MKKSIYFEQAPTFINIQLSHTSITDLTIPVKFSMKFNKYNRCTVKSWKQNQKKKL